MESREGMSSGVTVIAPDAPSSYNVVPRTENLTPGTGAFLVTPSGSSEKKKRGRPRKHVIDESGSRVLSATPISSSAPPLTGNSYLEQTSVAQPFSLEKRHKNKVGTEKLGEWLACSTGGSLLPHIITVDTGEDVFTKIMEFSLDGPRAVCIVSASGKLSNVTLQRPNSSRGTLTYQGPFEIVNLSGSFVPVEMSDPKYSTSAKMSITLSDPSGHLLGGLIGGLTTAASPVTLVVTSFLSSSHPETKPEKKRTESLFSSSASGSIVNPHSSNMEIKRVKAEGPSTIASGEPQIMPRPTIQVSNCAATQTADNSRKSQTDVDVSLQGK